MSGPSSPHSAPNLPEPPCTPKRSHASNFSAYNSTPYSKGTASHPEKDQPEHKYIDLYLKHDIKEDKRNVDLDLFMKNVLSTTCAPSSPDAPDDLDSIAIKKIAASATFTNLLDKYKASPSRETDLYPKFTRLCHNAIKQLVDEGITENELGFILCVQNPKTVCGSEARRIPDTVGTSVKAIQARIRDSMVEKRYKRRRPYKSGNNMNKGAVVTEEHTVEPLSTGDRLSWDDLFTFVEFKKEKEDEEESQETDAPQVLPSNPTSVTGPSKSLQNLTPDAHVAQAPISQALSRGGQTGSGLGPSKASSTSSKRSREHNVYEPLPASKKRRSMATVSESEPEPEPEPEPAKPPIDIWAQCAGYAHLLFNRGGIRTHVIGALVTHKVIQLLLYTRSRGCSTEAFDFVEDPQRFLRILLAFTRLDLSRWGFCDELRPCTLSKPQVPLGGGRRDPRMFDAQTLTLGKEEYDVRNIRLFPRGLIGRGTWTLSIRSKSKKKSQLILKISSPASTRCLEEVFIRQAVEKAKEQDKAKEADNAIDTYSSMLNHLPNLIDSGALSPDRDSLFQNFQELLGHDYEKRTLRYLVVEELFPITYLTNCDELIEAFKDIIKCHRWLVEDVKILHRDISVNNLMFRKQGGKKFGVLNDYDLASTIDDRSPSSKQRTGTKPFIAIELMAPVINVSDYPHFPRYDLESTVYVFAWIVCRYEGGKEIENPPFENWCYGEWESIADRKQLWIQNLGRHQVHPTASYSDLEPVLEGLREVLERGWDEIRQYFRLRRKNQKLADRTFKPETLNNSVTYDNILAAFDPPPPSPYVESPTSLLFLR